MNNLGKHSNLIYLNQNYIGSKYVILDMKGKTYFHCTAMCNGHFLAHYVHSMFRLLRLDVCTIPKMKIYFT